MAQNNNSYKEYVDWHAKNNFIKEQISKLEKLQEFPIFAIASFLFKSQLIEFELKQLILNLDLHLAFSNISDILKIEPRTPKEIDDKKFTLGKLKDELNRYDGNCLKDLKSHLGELVNSRNGFVHKLFNPGSINQLINEADKGLLIANRVIKDIDDIENNLKKHDPLKK